jgi:hypothetical protein
MHFKAIGVSRWLLFGAKRYNAVRIINTALVEWADDLRQRIA